MTPFGIVFEVHISQGDKHMALGLRSDDFRNEGTCQRALLALCASLEYAGNRLIDGKQVDEIALPFAKPEPR